MISACIIGGALVPAHVDPRDLTLIAPVFFEQFFVSGAWGPSPSPDGAGPARPAHPHRRLDVPARQPGV